MDYTLVDAKYVRQFIIWVRFDDGVEGEIDLKRELYGRSSNHCWIQLNFGSFQFIPSSTHWCGKAALTSLRSFSAKKRNSLGRQRQTVSKRYRVC